MPSQRSAAVRITGAYLTPEEWDQLRQLKTELQRARPGSRVTNSDVLRHALAVASGSAAPGGPVALTEPQQKRHAPQP